MFFVIDKSKIFSYVIAICTVVILFVAAAGLNQENSVNDTLTTSTNITNLNNINNVTNSIDRNNSIGNNLTNNIE